MKLQKEELGAVVSHIHNEIKKKHEVKLTKTEEREIKDVLEKRDKLFKESSALTQKADDIYKAFMEKHNISTSFYLNSSYDQVQQLSKEILKTRAPKFPSYEDIRQEVVMKSLFSDEKELKTFIKELVDKY